MVDVVCVGAHPDDVEIGMGGAVACMARQGISVAIVDLTDGEPTPHGTHEIRMDEAQRAARILGVAERRTLSQPNRYLEDCVEARFELAEVLRELRPSILFVPYAVDAHPDHVAAHQLAMAARFYAKLTKTHLSGDPHYPRRAYQYMAVHLRIVEHPSFVLDITADLATKLDALRAYESQFGAGGTNATILPMVEQMAGMWGALIASAAGEPFFTVEPIGIRSVADLL